MTERNWRGQFRGFWLGRSWVSECRNCGHTCFTVAQEEEHRKVECPTDPDVDHDKPAEQFSAGEKVT